MDLCFFLDSSVCVKEGIRKIWDVSARREGSREDLNNTMARDTHFRAPKKGGRPVSHFSSFSRNKNKVKAFPFPRGLKKGIG